MFAVVFEVLPSAAGYQRYLDIAAALRPRLDEIDGFLSIERFHSLSAPGWLLSLSLWRDEAALVQWRGDGAHHAAQAQGRGAIFDDYRIRVVRMIDGIADAGNGPLIGLHEDPVGTDGKRYESLATAGRRIALHEFRATGEALRWRDQARAVPAMCGVTLRDYGLFERAEAPQYFPDATTR
jgi:heme-degrading monooxygenase HmoA